MRLRRVVVSEEAATVEAVLSALAEAFPLGERRPEADLRAQWAAGVEQLWVCEDPSDASLAALAVVAPLPGTAAWLLDYLVVAPGARAQGLGGRFLRALRDRLVAEGAERCYVECDHPDSDPSDPWRPKRLAFFQRSIGAELLPDERHALPPLGGGPLYPMVLLCACWQGPTAPPAGEALALKRFIFERLYHQPLPESLG